MRRVGMVALLGLTMAVLPGGGVGAQATPSAGGCDVEPASLATATPGMTASGTIRRIPTDGPTADPETIADVQATLDELVACVAAGDLGRVAALFTPAGFATEVLAEEPVRIEPGTPGATPVADGSSLLTPPVDPGVIDRAFVLEDGAVAAYVDVASSSPQLVVLVQVDGGRWVIDLIEPLPSKATPERAAGAEDVPIAVWDAVVATLGLAGDATITVVTLESIAWPDAALGCPEEGNFYAQVITPGYRLIVEVDGERTELHTDLVGNAVACEA